MDPVKDKIKVGFAYKIGEGENNVTHTDFAGAFGFVDNFRQLCIPDATILEVISVYVERTGEFHPLNTITWKKL